jgi:hypothetical protein
MGCSLSWEAGMDDEPLVEQIERLWAGAHDTTPVGRLITAIEREEVPEDTSSIANAEEILSYLTLNSVATWDALMRIARRLDAADVRDLTE